MFLFYTVRNSVPPEHPVDSKVGLLNFFSSFGGCYYYLIGLSSSIGFALLLGKGFRGLPALHERK
jgi:hypothetical protein